MGTFSNTHRWTNIRAIRLEPPSGLISWSLNFSINTLQFTVLILSTLLLISTPGEGNRTSHRCYVCLPQDKSSSTAQDIISTFPGQKLSDCFTFDTQNAHQFQVDCPVNHVGCHLRINGSQISRTCSQHAVNDCKTANSVEFCYCATSLCNRDHPARRSRDYAEGAHVHHGHDDETTGIFKEGETDDEDLIDDIMEGSGLGDREEKHHELPKHIADTTTDKSIPHSPKDITDTTSTTDKSTLHSNKQADEDSHLNHNTVPDSNGEDSKPKEATASNATKLNNWNLNQLTFSIISFLLFSSHFSIYINYSLKCL